MNNLLRTMSVMLGAAWLTACQGERIDVQSPNGKLTVTVEASQETYGEALFAVDYQGERVLAPSRMGLETDARRLAGNLKLVSASEPQSVLADYAMPTGKRSHCTNQATERTYTFANEEGQTLDVILRAYDDGIAFCYGIAPAIAPDERVTAEHTAYILPKGCKRWMQEYDMSYERFFPLSTDGTQPDRPEVDQWGYPGLVQLRDSVFMLLTEANIRRGHCGSLLYNGEENGADRDCYQVRLADRPQVGSEAWQSPWRLLIMGSLADVVESTLVTDVSDPSKIEDADWAKPSMVSWIYWAHNHGSRDYRLVTDYIDLAARMDWPYNLIDAEWDEMKNGGDMEDALAYARQRGVKPIVWYNSATGWIEGPGPRFRLNKPEDREREYRWLSEQGAAGVKIDFFAGDDVATMDYCIDLLEDAARHRLMVNFHGATIPRGWQRTYPHLMTVEGVYGAEWYNNNGRLTDRAAAHNATLPFTRNVVGPMDYTPGTFTDSQHPHITTHGHELALTVLFESAMQHMPDRPSTYDQLPEAVRRLLSTLPTAWDDTRLLSGYPGEDVVLARRKGDTWYVAGINGTNEPRTLRVPLGEISRAGHMVTFFKDGADAHTFLIEENQPFSAENQEWEISCLPRGGFVGVIR